MKDFPDYQPRVRKSPDYPLQSARPLIDAEHNIAYDSISIGFFDVSYRGRNVVRYSGDPILSFGQGARFDNTINYLSCQMIEDEAIR